MPVEAFELGEEMRLGEMPVDYPHGVARIVGDLKVASDGVDSLHVARGDVAGSPDQREVRQSHLQIPVVRP